VSPHPTPTAPASHDFGSQRCAGLPLTVDLVTEEIRPRGGPAVRFQVEPHRKSCLLNGMDDIAQTMERSPAIAQYEARLASRPWV